MTQINFEQLLAIYLFLGFYAIERSIFAFTVPYAIRTTRLVWLTFIPFLTYIVLFFASVVEFSLTTHKTLNYIISIVGVFALASGILLRYQAVRIFRINGQKWMSHIDAENISALITKGPYKFIRHPYYLSVMLELCGIALFINSFRTIIFIFLIQEPLLWQRIVTEESELIRKFGEQYLLYKKQVPAILLLWSKKK